MPPITLYTTPFCGYCMAAKRLLDKRGAGYAEIDVSRDPAARAEMVQRALGGRTVPQIFIGEAHVGGYTELDMLERTGRLEPMLAG
jgi:glutaredoxin 3